MKVKSVFLSKIAWLNLITTVIAVLDVLSKSPFITPEIMPFVLFGVGVLNLVLRIWFTDSALKLGK